MSNLDLGTLVARLAADTTDLVSGLNDADSRLGAWSRGAGKLLAAGGLAAGGLFAASLVKGLENEKGLDKVAARMGLNGKQNARLGKMAGELYADAYGSSVEDTANAISAVQTSIPGMMKASEDEIKKATAIAMDYANVFEVDITEAANTAGQMITNGLAKDHAQAMDLMTKASQKMPDAMKGELGPILDEYGKDFAALGLTGEQATAMIVEASKGGAIQIDKMGDSLKEFKLLATDPAKAEVLTALGLDAKAMSNELLAGGDRAKAATTTIANALLGIKDPSKQAAMTVELFGSPIEDMGKETAKTTAYLKNLAGPGGMKGVEGAADKMSKAVNDNAATSIDGLKRKAEMLFLGLANWAIPKVTEVVQKLDKDFGPAAKRLGKAFEEDVLPKIEAFAGFITGTVIPVVSKIIGWLGKHTGVVKTVAGAIGALIIVTKIHAAVMAVQAAGGLLAMASGLRVVSAVTKAYTAVQWLLNAAMNANPAVKIVMILLLLAGVFVTLWKNSETFRKIVTGAFDAVKGAASKALGWLRTNWPLALAILTGPVGLAVYAIVKNWDKIKEGAANMVRGIREKLGSMLDFITGLKDKVATKAAGMWDGIKDAFRGMINTLIGWWNGLSFSLPEVDTKIPGVGVVGGFTLQVPQIPELAEGGYIPATPGGRVVKVAEAGEAEIVAPERKIEEAVIRAMGKSRGNVQHNYYLQEVLTGNRMDNLRTARDLAARTAGV